MNKHYFYYFVHEKKTFGCGTCSCASTLFPLSEITRDIRKKGDSSAIISFWKEISREEYEKMNEMMNSEQSLGILSGKDLFKIRGNGRND